MQEHRNEDRVIGPTEHELYVDKAVLGLLLERYPAVVADFELRRVLIEAPERPELTRPEISDGMTRLVASGLAHRVDGRMSVASASAIRAAELLDY